MGKNIDSKERPEKEMSTTKGNEKRRFLSLSASVLFIFLVLFNLFGLYTFAHGFLLTRSVVTDVSLSCSLDAKGRCVKPRFNRAVILVIDALRYDFAFFNETFAAQNLSTAKNTYINHLPTIHRLISESRKSNSDDSSHAAFAQLYKFIADAPTTTLQRLKGLTTGSLPTFIDAGSNFDGSEIEEDNILAQIKADDKNIVVMGDDTWMSLFPKSFLRSFPLPSFNVRDLHSVDNGVIEHIYSEMQKSDWSVIIGHFLGVDHVGHTFGPRHNSMATKLDQMDKVLAEVVENLESDTILFVMGDHGMTEHGDHGGDSKNEVNAALFAYAPLKSKLVKSDLLSGVEDKDKHHNHHDDWDNYLRITDKVPPSNRRVIKQTDFVPTISLLLGLPIPFSNLGGVIPDLFFSIPKLSDEVKVYYTENDDIDHIIDKFQDLNEAMMANAAQINQYLQKYSKISNDLPAEDLKMMQQQYMEALLQYNKLYESNKAKNGERKKIFHQSRLVYEKISLYLDDVRELCGRVWAKFNVKSMLGGIFILSINTLLALVLAVYVATLDSPVQNMFENGMTRKVFLFAVFSGGLMTFLNTFLELPLPFIVGFFLTISSCLLAQSVLLFPPSFSKLKFRTPSLPFVVSIVCLLMSSGVFFSNSFVVYEDMITRYSVCSLISAFALDTLRKNYFLQIKPDTSLILHWFLICGCIRLSSHVYACREEQESCQTLTLYNSWITLDTVLWCLHVVFINDKVYQGCKIFFVLMLSLTFAYWQIIIHTGNDLANLPPWQQVILPWLVYMLSFGCCFSLTRMDPRSRNIESDFMTIIITLLCLSALLTEVMYAHVYFLHYLTLMCFWYLYKNWIRSCNDNATGCVLSFQSWAGSVAFVLLSMHMFYSTGHQTIFSAIQWSAAFVGFETMNYYLAVFLLVLNTFSGAVVCSVFILLQSLYYEKANERPFVNETQIDSKTNEIVDPIEGATNKNFTGERSKVIIVGLLYTFALQSLLFTASTIATAIHRRHLMVWKIFAPRLLFEGVKYILVSILILCLILFWLFFVNFRKIKNEI